MFDSNFSVEVVGHLINFDLIKLTVEGLCIESSVLPYFPSNFL